MSKKRSVLITGDAGFVGRHFSRALDHCDLTCIDIVNGHDARDFFRTDKTHFDLVLHLAAVVGGRTLIEGSPLSLAVDLSLDAEMFSWAMRTRPEQVVYFSSSAAYPVELQRRGTTTRLKETMVNVDDVRSPDLTYGWAKLTGEILAKHARDDDLSVLVLRPFSGYGADQALDYPFPSFIARAKQRLDPFEIWGDGTQIRDFIHINDIVMATLMAVEHKMSTTFNLGTGIPTSFNDLAEMVTSVVGYHPEIKHLPAKPVGVHYRVCDPTELERFYKPTITIEEGIEMALNLGRPMARASALHAGYTSSSLVLGT